MNAPIPEDTAKPGCDRRLKIMEEAARVFFEKGFAGACIDDVIARAGGSKRTIYNEFGNKEGLFTTMVRTMVSQYSVRLVTSLNAVEQTGAPIRQVLIDFARQYLEIVMDPDVLAMNRTIIAEGGRFPGLAAAFYENGPARSSRRLAEILEQHCLRGEIDVKDFTTAAEHFSGIMRDLYFWSVLLGVRAPPTKDELERRAISSVDLFLNGVRKDHAL